MSFKKTIKNAPESARTFANGDISVKADEYVKGQPMFAYYKKTKAGYSIEKLCFTGRAASGYNHAKMNNPNFVPAKQFDKAKLKAKQAKVASSTENLKVKPANPLPLTPALKEVITDIAQPKVVPLFDQR